MDSPPLLILASKSPRRRQLLERIGLAFAVHSPEMEEPAYSGNDPVAYVRELARLKAKTVAVHHPDQLVIGADTIVVIDNNVLGKPDDISQAIDMLTQLSGKWHEVYTAYSLQMVSKHVDEVFHETTLVHFRKLTQDEIDTYVRTGNPLDKAGAYGIQDYSAIFVDRIKGCFYNVVGLPVAHFYQNYLKIIESIA